MAASGPQPPLWLALLAIAVLAFVWQLYRALRLGCRPQAFPHAAFWLSAAAWTTLGMYAHAPGLCPQPTVLWRWVLPIGGLLATALLRWVAGVQPQLMLEVEALPEQTGASEEAVRQNGHPAEGDLDAEDLKLLGRMRSLLGKRAGDLMVSVQAAPTVRADADAEAVVSALTRNRARRVAVLDEAGLRSPGVIDGLGLVLRLIDQDRGVTGPPAPRSKPARARQLCRPIPTVPTWRPAHEALEILRSGGSGMTAVVDARDRVQGFLAWQPLFRALLGRTPQGGRL